MVSAGDSGSAGCDYANCQIASYAVGGLSVNGLASTPYNVAVGGTDFYYPNYQNLTDAELENLLESDHNPASPGFSATSCPRTNPGMKANLGLM